jgi:Lipid A 3-O-deacylase (PagL)
VLTVRLSAALLVFGLVASPGFASQDTPVPEMPFEKGAIEISILGGTALPISLFRANPDHKISMASLQIGRIMSGGASGHNLQFIVDGSPFIHIRQPDSVRGWSVSPLFVRWNFPPTGRRGARIYGEFSGGVLFTSQPVPVRTTTFNFIDQAGFGVRFEEAPGRAWLVGYRFQHVSNAGRVKPNPGANFNFIYLAVSFIR